MILATDKIKGNELALLKATGNDLKVHFREMIAPFTYINEDE